jgi:predicted DNA-binding protein
MREQEVGTVNMSFRISPCLRSRIRIVAARVLKTIQTYMVEALEDRVKKDEELLNGGENTVCVDD